MAYEQTSNDCWEAPITSSVAAYDYAPCGDLILAIINTVSSILHSPFSILHSYAYDALGRPILRNADTFGYNARGEVVSATVAGGAPSPATAEYGYDGIGNSTNWIANCLNQYSPFTYDADGNLLTNGAFTYAYDADNRLASISSNGTLLATFAYDAQGRRVRKIVSHGGTEAHLCGLSSGLT